MGFVPRISAGRYLDGANENEALIGAGLARSMNVKPVGVTFQL